MLRELCNTASTTKLNSTILPVCSIFSNYLFHLFPGSVYSRYSVCESLVNENQPPNVFPFFFLIRWNFPHLFSLLICSQHFLVLIAQSKKNKKIFFLLGVIYDNNIQDLIEKLESSPKSFVWQFHLGSN